MSPVDLTIVLCVIIDLEVSAGSEKDCFELCKILFHICRLHLVDRHQCVSNIQFDVPVTINIIFYKPHKLAVNMVYTDQDRVHPIANISE